MRGFLRGAAGLLALAVAAVLVVVALHAAGIAAP